MSHPTSTLKQQKNAKFWLSPVMLDWAVGYNSKELRRVRELVEQHADFYLEKWEARALPVSCSTL